MLKKNSNAVLASLVVVGEFQDDKPRFPEICTDFTMELQGLYTSMIILLGGEEHVSISVRNFITFDHF